MIEAEIVLGARNLLDGQRGPAAAASSASDVPGRRMGEVSQGLPVTRQLRRISTQRSKPASVSRPSGIGPSHRASGPSDLLRRKRLPLTGVEIIRQGRGIALDQAQSSPQVSRKRRVWVERTART